MTDLRTAAQQALEALEEIADDVFSPYDNKLGDAILALRAALAQQDEPVQEPVAWSFEARHIDTAWGSAVSLKHPGREHKYMRNVKPLYLAPPQRKPLTDEEINALELPPSGTATVRDLVRLIERAHGIGEQP